MSKLLQPKVRLYLYGVAIAFVPLAVWLGWLKPEATPIVLPLILAVFNVPLKDAQETQEALVVRSTYIDPTEAADGAQVGTDGRVG